MSSLRSLLPVLASVWVLAATPALSANEPSAWDKVKAFAHSQKEQAVVEAKKAIAAIDEKMTDMSKQAKQSGAETKAAYQQNMKELAAKKKDAEASLAKLQASSSGAWDATKEGFGKAYQDLHQAYEKAAASMKQ